MKINSSIKIFRSVTAAAEKARCFFSSLESVPRETVDAVVIGAGVVGIAVARELAMKLGKEVLVVESAPSFGTGSSSRNSEVIHAGVYYPQNSLKIYGMNVDHGNLLQAQFCLRGRHLLYDYCRAKDIPHKQIGKLIVATRPSEIPELSELIRRGAENGVEGLKRLNSQEAMRLEPELHCTKALLSPVSGIIDSHSLILSLLECSI